MFCWIYIYRPYLVHIDVGVVYDKKWHKTYEAMLTVHVLAYHYTRKQMINCYFFNIPVVRCDIAYRSNIYFDKTFLLVCGVVLCFVVYEVFLLCLFWNYCKTTTWVFCLIVSAIPQLYFDIILRFFVPAAYGCVIYDGVQEAIILKCMSKYLKKI